MKKYIKEISIVGLQLLLFYFFPLFAGPTDAIGMVLLLLLSVLISSFLLGIVSKNKVKLFYPIVIAVLFIPSVFIYYNESALVHTLWYLAISFVGVGAGSLIRILFAKF